MGALCVYNPSGLTQKLWEAGLIEFDKAKQTGNGKLGYTVMGKVCVDSQAHDLPPRYASACRLRVSEASALRHHRVLDLQPGDEGTTSVTFLLISLQR